MFEPKQLYIWHRKKPIYVNNVRNQEERGPFSHWTCRGCCVCVNHSWGPIHTGRGTWRVCKFELFPLMLLACSVDTPIHINRSHLLASRCASRPASCVDWASVNLWLKKTHNKKKLVQLRGDISKLSEGVMGFHLMRDTSVSVESSLLAFTLAS